MAIQRPSTESIWKFLIVIAIGLAAGPDIFAALEMRILLEILGAALFTTAFIAGGRLLLDDLRMRACDLLVPPAQRALIRSDAPISDKFSAALYQLFHLPPWLGLVAVVMVLVVTLVRAA
jgi:hypothetical protein